MDRDVEYANYLSKKAVAEIKKAEKDLGALLIAYATPPVPAKLTKVQLAKIKELETKHCIRLVAYTRGK
jgi:hypothetical protein